MKHFRDDDLILFRYGESPDAEAIRDALATDPELARRYAELEQTLDALDAVEAPEPAPAFEAALWRRLRPRLAAPAAPERSWWSWLGAGAGWRLAAAGAAALALVAGGFLAGRAGAPPPQEGAAQAAGLPDAARERVLLASVAGHLDSSERLLTGLVNDQEAGDAEERALAQALLDSNRLYRRAAERAGQRRIVALLDQLEPVLTELANAPAGAGGLDDVRRRVEEDDLLFKVRIVGGRLETPVPAGRPLSPTSTL